MIDDETYSKLNDYFDGLLSGANGARLRRRSRESRIAGGTHGAAALRAEASILPRGLEPERDLWKHRGAHWRDRAGRRRKGHFLRPGTRSAADFRVELLLAAAALLLMLLGGQYM